MMTLVMVQGKMKPWMPLLEKSLSSCILDASSHKLIDENFQLLFECVDNKWQRCQMDFTSLANVCRRNVSHLCGYVRFDGDQHFLGNLASCDDHTWQFRVSHHFTINLTFVDFALRQGRTGHCMYGSVTIDDRKSTTRWGK